MRAGYTAVRSAARYLASLSATHVDLIAMKSRFLSLRYKAAGMASLPYRLRFRGTDFDHGGD